LEHGFNELSRQDTIFCVVRSKKHADFQNPSRHLYQKYAQNKHTDKYKRWIKNQKAVNVFISENQNFKILIQKIKKMTASVAAAFVPYFRHSIGKSQIEMFRKRFFIVLNYIKSTLYFKV
jgi:hypothetical protein